jgi:hypothetical protein
LEFADVVCAAKIFFQKVHISLHAYTKCGLNADKYDKVLVFEPTQSLHKAYTVPTRFMRFLT